MSENSKTLFMSSRNVWLCIEGRCGDIVKLVTPTGGSRMLMAEQTRWRSVTE